MSLLDDVLTAAGGNSAQQTQNGTALAAIMHYINSPQVGGLAGLQNMFQQGGIGNILSSWVGNGQNMPVSASQLQNVLHSGALQEAAQKMGMDPTQLTGSMASLLPHLIDKLSPSGQMPTGSSLQQMLQGLSGSAKA